MTSHIDDVDLGRKQPQNIDAEKAILCVLMLDNNAITEVYDLLSPDSFYLESHKAIYESMLSLDLRNDPISLLSIAEELNKKGCFESCGGAMYLVELSNITRSIANVRYNAQLVHQCYVKREQIRMANEVIKKAYDPADDPFATIDFIEEEAFKLDMVSPSDPINGQILLSECYDVIAKLRSNPNKSSLTGLNTGFRGVNEITGGLNGGELIIVAARPGIGKTAFANALAVNSKAITVYFSIEMGKDQIMNRFISSEARIPQDGIRSGNVSMEDLTRIQELGHKFRNIYIDDSPSITVSKIKREAKKINAENKIGLIIIDYLQLIQSSSAGRGNREQEVAAISRNLKILSKELNIPVVVLAQLSREVDKRTNKRPMLSDLRESGSIEQDADLVMFLYRDEYYNKDGVLEDGTSNKGVAEIIIGKNRNGNTGTVTAKFIGEYTRFEDIRDEIESPRYTVDLAKIIKGDDFDSNFIQD